VGVPEIVQPDPRQLVLPQRPACLSHLLDEPAGVPLGVPVGAVEGPEDQRGVAESRPRAPREFVGPSTSSSPAPLVFTVPTLRRTCGQPASRSTARQRRTNASPRRIEASTTDGRAQGDGAGEDLHTPQLGAVFRG
jgi:hypothetical protein